MKLSPLMVLLAGALVGALAWGSCNANRASDAENRLNASLAAQRDSAAHWQATREGLITRLGALQRDSLALAVSYHAAQAQAGVARHRLDSLLAGNANVALGEAVGRVLTADSVQLETCQATIGNCELRAQNAEARVHGDSLQLLRLTALTDTLGAAWHSAERRAQPSFFRDLWRSRSVTLPLAVLSVFLVLTHH
jgi:hypothetical protein